MIWFWSELQLDCSHVAVQGGIRWQGAALPLVGVPHNRNNTTPGTSTISFLFSFSSGVGEPANYWRPNSPGLVLWLA